MPSIIALNWRPSVRSASCHAIALIRPGKQRREFVTQLHRASCTPRRPAWPITLVVAFTLCLPSPAQQQNSAPGASSQKALDLDTVGLPSQARATLAAAQAAHPGNTPEVAIALVNLLYSELAASDFNQQTMEIADQALKVAEAAEGSQSGAYAIALAAKARLLVFMDRPELARPLAEEAVATEQRLANDPRALAEVADTLSVVCLKAGDKPCGVKYAGLQVNSLRGIQGLNPATLATALINLMQSRFANSDRAGARAAASEAADIAGHFELDEPAWIEIENNLGYFYIYDGQLPEALVHLNKSLAIDVKLFGPDHVTQGAVLANLGYVEMGLGHAKEGLDHYARARAALATHFGPAYSVSARVEAAYGHALIGVGRYQEAINIELASHRVLRERTRLAIRLMPEQQALAMASADVDSFNIALSLAVHHPQLETRQIYQEVIRSRALVAEEMAHRQAALSHKHDPALKALEDDLENEGKRVLELQGEPPAGQAASSLNDALATMEKTERELAERSAAYRADERARDGEIADLRANMPPGSVVVSYVAYAKYPEGLPSFNMPPIRAYMAFVMSRDSRRIAVYDLGDSASIALLVNRIRNSADAEAASVGLGSTRNEREYRDAALELRRRIWDPLQKDLRLARLVLVVPDGILNLVPFSSLPVNRGYLVEHGPVVHILTSEKDLLPDPVTGKKAGLLAVGSPAFELAQTRSSTAPDPLRGAPIQCEALGKMRFQPLPASLSEVQGISSTWKRWTAGEAEQLLTGEDATRLRFLDAAPQSRVLHLATHAFVLDRSCGNGNPLLHSGLAFAGANKTRDTSILTALQIASLDLSGVDWAVLSACNTGYGELKDGEGVLGLQRSFRVAGAKSVVMALWSVDDQVTSRYMRELYTQLLARHAPTATATWLSARKLLLERRAAGLSTHPWYWAGFVSSGSWR